MGPIHGLYFIAVLIIGYQFVLRPILDLFWKENFFTNAVAVGITYVLMNTGFVLVRTSSLGFLWDQMKKEVVVDGGGRLTLASFSDMAYIHVFLCLFLFYIMPLLCGLLWRLNQFRHLWDLDELYGLRVSFYAIAGLLLMIFTGVNSNDFIYFKF